MWCCLLCCCTELCLGFPGYTCLKRRPVGEGERRGGSGLTEIQGLPNSVCLFFPLPTWPYIARRTITRLASDLLVSPLMSLCFDPLPRREKVRRLRCIVKSLLAHRCCVVVLLLRKREERSGQSGGKHADFFFFFMLSYAAEKEKKKQKGRAEDALQIRRLLFLVLKAV